jgi:hypothetical protein
MMLKNRALLCTAVIAVLMGCSSTDAGTKLADYGEGGLASAQVVSGKTSLMSPRLEDVTPDSFNIRYVEFAFGYGTPMNVNDMAIAQCESVEKVVTYKASSRGLVQGNTVKAYYQCRSQN